MAPQSSSFNGDEQKDRLENISDYDFFFFFYKNQTAKLIFLFNAWYIDKKKSMINTYKHFCEHKIFT